MVGSKHEIPRPASSSGKCHSGRLSLNRPPCQIVKIVRHLRLMPNLRLHRTSTAPKHHRQGDSTYCLKPAVKKGYCDTSGRRGPFLQRALFTSRNICIVIQINTFKTKTKLKCIERFSSYRAVNTASRLPYYGLKVVVN